MASLGPSHTKGHRRGRRTRRLMGEINITPFVDVVLVLLIVFMVAAPLLTVGVPVDLPKTEAKSMANEQEPISITILADGQIYLQSEQVAFDDLMPRLTAASAEQYDRRIFIRGDSTADYGVVMQVMARINSAGYRNLGLITDPISK
ncbi:MAG: biopolymer transport protein TolR [Hyphomonadaceae bacterium]|jgi:biopolymer transport protein TolR|nr:MAG: biopolymer transport protein TolR [Hyphomonadaceae bacterium]KAF0186899.1 MAG: biopolymer transport protein TolR [Hyphomonadaceae bacterium]